MCTATTIRMLFYIRKISDSWSISLIIKRKAPKHVILVILDSDFNAEYRQDCSSKCKTIFYWVVNLLFWCLQLCLTIILSQSWEICQAAFFERAKRVVPYTGTIYYSIQKSHLIVIFTAISKDNSNIYLINVYCWEIHRPHQVSLTV